MRRLPFLVLALAIVPAGVLASPQVASQQTAPRPVTKLAFAEGTTSPDFFQYLTLYAPGNGAAHPDEGGGHVRVKVTYVIDAEGPRELVFDCTITSPPKPRGPEYDPCSPYVVREQTISVGYRYTIAVHDANDPSRLGLGRSVNYRGVEAVVRGVAMEIEADRVLVAERVVYSDHDFGSGRISGATVHAGVPIP